MKNTKFSVLLINPGQESRVASQHTVPHRIHRDIPPLSGLTLGSYLEKYGGKVILLDCHIDTNYKESIKNIIVSEEVRLVGITTFIGNFITNAQEITEYIKSEYPQIPVVWGGPLTSTLPEACLKEGKADYIVFFSGEEPLRLLIETLRNNFPREDIPGIGFLKDGAPFYTRQDSNQVIHNDTLNWGLLGSNINIKQVPYLAYLFTSRGCPYGCRFCYHQIDARKDFRRCFFRSAENVLGEMDILNKKYGITVFSFGDDNFFSNKTRVVKILAGMKERGYFIEQAIGTFSDFNDEIIEGLKGICQTIICSIETASEGLLKLINKPINLAKVPEINQRLSIAGVNTVHNFIFGIPGETDSDRRAAVDLMIRLKSINPFVRGVAYFFIPLPGTPMCEDIENFHGKFPRSFNFWKDCEFIGLEESYKFRPWLEKEEQIFISEFITIFKELFQSINRPPSKEQGIEINSSPRLKYIFSNIDQVNFPADTTPRYLLDKVLKEKNVEF